jgi:hypothetical protein
LTHSTRSFLYFLLATYYFVDEGNKQKFENNPDNYAPQFGGFCAFGISLGALLPVDLTTAEVYNEKLYFNLNHDVVGLFNEEKDGAIAKAVANFPGLVEKHAS